MPAPTPVPSNPLSLPSAVAAHRDWVRGTLLGVKPATATAENRRDLSGTPTLPEGWTETTWHASHPKDGDDAKGAINHAKLSKVSGAPDTFRYPVTAHLPPGFVLSSVPGRNRDTKNPLVPLVKADTAGHTTCEGGRWITVHSHGEDEPGQAVYLCPNPDGSHTIAGGAGGRLNGLRLNGVKSEQEYKSIARDKREERVRQAKLAQEIHQTAVGAQQYQAEQEQKRALVESSGVTRRDKERSAIARVLQAQGVDPSVMDVPKEALQGLDAKTAKTVQDRYHRSLLAYAKRIGDSVRGMVDAGIEGVAHDATGEIGVGDLVRRSVTGGGGGLGYASPVSALADDMGLSPAEKQSAVEGVKLRSLMERSDLNLAQASAKQEQGKERGAARAESEGKVKDAVDALAKQGIGGAAIASLPTTAGVSTMGDAVAVLKALKEADAAAAAHQGLARAAGAAGGIETLPKALLIPVKEMTDDEAKDAIAGDIDENRRRAAMVALVGKSNDAETASPKSLSEHLSVGQSAAFNSICAAMDGSSIDPILHDVLGASGAAAVLAARWRASLSPEDFDKACEVLASHHVNTQVQIANAAVQEAGEYQDAADSIDPNRELPTDPQELAASLADQAKRLDLLSKARETLGVARGRLEAAAALNAAMARSKATGLSGAPESPGGDSSVVPLGAMAPAAALDAALALGLDKPAQYDPATGAVTDPGQFDIHHDGHNAFLTLSPAGVGALAKKWGADPELSERAEHSRRIKRGDEDEAGYVPEGLTRRPVSSFETEPLEVQRPDIATIGIADGDSDAAMGDKVRGFVGAMLAAGRDPKQIESLLRSEEFKAGLGLSNAGVTRYEGALATLSPQWTPKRGMTPQEQVEAHRNFEQERDAAYQGCLDEHLQKTAGADVALDGQRLPTDGTTADCAYVSALSDPRLRFAFHKVGDLSPDARACVRRYAYEHLFHLDPKADADTLLQPLSPEERRAFDGWNALGDTHGDQYGAIQAAWKAKTDADVDLFGDPAPPHALASVNLADDTSVVQAARAVPQTLGYAPTQTRDPATGAITQAYSDLEPTDARSLSSIATDARSRIRQALRQHYMGEMLNLPDLADNDFNPANVKTAGDRWGEYAASMGETNAYRAVQEFMQGDFAKRFAGEYAKRTGTRLNLAMRPVSKSDQHAVAMLPPQQRAALQNMDKGERAKFIKRFRGKWVKTEGGVKDSAEASKIAGQEGAALFAGDPAQYHVETERASLGTSAEGTLASLLPHLSVSAGGTSAASGLDFSGERAPIQRAIKLICENKRQGLNLGTGMGKTVTSLGAFTKLRAEGKAKRALFVVPSKVAPQFPSEIDKFRDPSVPLFHYCASGASPSDRRAAMANPDLHVVVTTAEALRGDIVRAVADHQGVTEDVAAANLSGAPESERNAAIHAAMAHAGYDFDYSLFDEGHRLLSRQGKGDALMAQVGDAVGARSPYYVYSTADPIKNDVSEAWDVLHKMDAGRYPPGSRDSFLRTYGRDTKATGLALQRVMEPYLYPEKIDLGIDTQQVLPEQGKMKLTPEQQGAHDAVIAAYKRARVARMGGRVDIDALKVLSPGSFAGVTGTAALRSPRSANVADETRVAAGLNRALATTRDARIAQVVNALPGGAKENFVSQYLGERKGEPAVVFAHHLNAARGIAARLKAEGHRVVMQIGDMDANTSTRARLAFQPPNGAEPTADVIVLSDAGATGSNLQRGVHQINVDVPLTAMVHQQRLGRIRRMGQKAGSVNAVDLVTDTDFDQRARVRLADKQALRELITSPSASIDDSGLMSDLEAAGVARTAAAARKKYGGQTA